MLKGILKSMLFVLRVVMFVVVLSGTECVYATSNRESISSEEDEEYTREMWRDIGAARSGFEEMLEGMESGVVNNLNLNLGGDSTLMINFDRHYLTPPDEESLFIVNNREYTRYANDSSHTEPMNNEISQIISEPRNIEFDIDNDPTNIDTISASTITPTISAVSSQIITGIRDDNIEAIRYRYANNFFGTELGNSIIENNHSNNLEEEAENPSEYGGRYSQYFINVNEENENREENNNGHNQRPDFSHLTPELRDFWEFVIDYYNCNNGNRDAINIIEESVEEEDDNNYRNSFYEINQRDSGFNPYSDYTTNSSDENEESDDDSFHSTFMGTY